MRILKTSIVLVINLAVNAADVKHHQNVKDLADALADALARFHVDAKVPKKNHADAHARFLVDAKVPRKNQAVDAVNAQ